MGIAGLELATIVMCGLPAQAQFKVLFTPPPGARAPLKSVGGASRGSVCAAGAEKTDQKLTLLLPQSNHGLTASTHPTFFGYVPASSATKIFFSLRDEKNKTHYQVTLPITGQEEIVQIQLPKTVAALEPGKNYQWGIAMLCGNKLRADSPIASGWIQRIVPSAALVKTLNSKTLLERASFYGKQGLWYDTVQSMFEVRLQDPNNQLLTSNWQELMDNAGLKHVSRIALRSR
ncbi:MAG: DUF928 domain-containing protein [Synechococcales bacterium]|nr:DUF928 domain-containing protein [Synechococcales bacterium]